MSVLEIQPVALNSDLHVYFPYLIGITLSSIYSQGYYGVVGEEQIRIQCNITGNTTITQNTLTNAFLVIAKQLSGIVIAESSDISGKYIIHNNVSSVQ